MDKQEMWHNRARIPHLSATNAQVYTGSINSKAEVKATARAGDVGPGAGGVGGTGDMVT